MEGTMPKNKSTRWDCDVGLWRGIPATPPSFYGWNMETRSFEKKNPPDKRFYVCHHCNTYVEQQDVSGHPCWDTPVKIIEDEEDEEEDFDNDWENFKKNTPEKKHHSFVVVTDENEGDGRCSLCLERMKLEYDLDLEEWVYIDCIEIERKAIHKECHNIASGILE